MRKTFSALLALALLVTLLAGCAGESGSTTSTTTTVATTEAATAATTAATTAAATTATTTTAATTASETAATVVPDAVEHNLKFLARSTDEFQNREDQPSWKALEEMMAKKNITMDFELVTDDQFFLVVQTRLASAMDLPDMLMTGGVAMAGMPETQTVQLGRQGILLDIRDVLAYSDGTFESQINKYFPLTWKVIQQNDGAMYYVTNTDTSVLDGQPYEKDPLNKGLLYRRDWADKLGIAEPTNAAEFSDMVIAFREQDANGNGVQDEVMWMNLWHFNNGISNWFGLGIQYSANDFFTGNNTIDGPNEVNSNWYMPGIKDYIMYMNNFVQKGVLNPENVNAAATTWTELENSNKISAKYQYLSSAWPTVEGAPDLYYQTLGALPAVDGITALGLASPVNGIGCTFSVTKACEDLPGMAAFLDTLWSDEAMMLTQYGIDGLSYKIDENGQIVNLNAGMSIADAMEQKRAAGRYIWQQTAIPRPLIQYNYSVPTEEDARGEEYVNRVLEISKYPYYTLSGFYYAPSTDEQAEWQAKNETALETYEQELLTNLVLGNWSLDDWDSYIANLKKLGLDECVEMYRDRSNRFFGK